MESTVTMITPGLARDLAALGRLGEATSTESVLRGLTTALADGVPGCSGSAAEHWRDQRVVVSGSHSELITLVDEERRLGEGPSAEARRTAARVMVGDVLSEGRWPRYAALANRWAVRSILVLPIQVGPALLIVGLYSVRPGAFSPVGAHTLADMLTQQVGVAMSNMWDFEEVRTDAAQLQEALNGRAVIDQAKGIIMQTSGCTAEAAFEELRRISQHHQVKVADLARLLVDEHQRKSRR
ncbi:GAF and ANTAR domain-containing protein [Nonomuraea sp. SMC257]|uniref:GAF and ANTAR domain-containing protein n=1 Tax=Nonomuraea montanisoli TaxID=2741721 RepID=A0A7Y6IAI6_9ACTN|nr:GAF and ANTAR domain-containing protein [Nonomuraea montanisoli]NUW34506.1 GAF and ANTAR domain-containing protein [Nonomuraea montanisoli]